MNSLPLIGGLIAASCWLSPAQAAAARRGAVEVELVSAVATIQPGHAFAVAIRLNHDPGWHTYAANAGEGYATTVRWHFPSGWRGGEIQWPVPQLLISADGAIIGDGYTGEAFLFATLEPPADLAVGRPATLSATVRWLMARDELQPATATLTLSVPVSAGPPRPNSKWGPRMTAARARLARPAEHWRLAATPAGQFVRLSLRPPAGISLDPLRLHFFADDGWIAFDQAQRVRRVGHLLMLELPLAGIQPAPPVRLRGVLAAADGTGPAYRINLALSAASSPAKPAGAPADASEPVANRRAAAALLVYAGLALSFLACLFPAVRSRFLTFKVRRHRGRSRAESLISSDDSPRELTDPTPPFRLPSGRKG